MAIGEGHADLDVKHAAAVTKYMERSPLTVPMLRKMWGGVPQDADVPRGGRPSASSPIVNDDPLQQ
jgi:hypothetical protein